MLNLTVSSSDFGKEITGVFLVVGRLKPEANLW